MSTYYIFEDCRYQLLWNGVYGRDLDGADQAIGNNLETYSGKTLTECKTLCESTYQCHSIHFYRAFNKDFPNCNLKDSKEDT